MLPAADGEGKSNALTIRFRPFPDKPSVLVAGPTSASFVPQVSRDVVRISERVRQAEQAEESNKSRADGDSRSDAVVKLANIRK